MNGSLLNYTTTIDPQRSIGEVCAALVGAGARSISTEYADDGVPSAVSFTVPTQYGLRHFVLPVSPEKVLAVLLAARTDTRRRIPDIEQAQRVAWRILKDWVEAQLAIIRTEMVTLEQVMLPYMVAGRKGETVFDLYLASGMAELGAGS